ncbi:hypothetical protein SAMN05428949_5330 [Chitinophaga sp. YR627]|uniref:hypothetical protein n=1 Tax=Chitinophaga sp. YR627 TaxID=1881041 RepID=UPI0008E412E0|nr:hypothetical protein [Chitinophaga sp. YR627]SFO48027.1 hypothetical protein SAMN05428949_5330 [Chitinophaga sp. YR627]
MSRRNVRRIGRQVTTSKPKSKPAFRMKKKSQRERDNERFDRYIAYIDNEDRVNQIIINTLKRLRDQAKADSELSQSV